MSEKFSLKWNEFQVSVCGSFKDVREDEDFSDVTLVSDDDKHMKANKVILAASSSVFRNIIKSNRHPYPVIFLRGFKSCYLEYLLDFIYLGEVKVPQEDLKEFLDSAEDLKIKGLTEKSLENMQSLNSSNEIKQELPAQTPDDDVIEIVDTYEDTKTQNIPSEFIPNKQDDYIERYPKTNLSSKAPVVATKGPMIAMKQLNAGKIQKIILKPVLTENNRVTLKRTVVVTNPDSEDKRSNNKSKDDLHEKPESGKKPPVQFANIQSELNLLEHFEQFESLNNRRPNVLNDKRVFSDAFPPNTLSELDSSSDAQDDTLLKMFSVREASGYTCKPCGEFSNHRQIMKRHIQRNHMHGMEHGCSLCGKTFSSRNRLSSHISTVHNRKE